MLDNFPFLETADIDDLRLVFELSDSVYRLAFFAFKFKRGVLDIVFFEPVLDFSFNEFNPEQVCLRRVNMGVDDVNVRAEIPQMTIADAARSLNPSISLMASPKWTSPGVHSRRTWAESLTIVQRGMDGPAGIWQQKMNRRKATSI